jgi:hypothetical protein
MKHRKLVLPVFAALALGGVSLAQSPPVCISGSPYVAECTGPITLVPVDGSASFDPDGTPTTFFWFDECSFGSFEDPTSAQTNWIMDNTGFCTRTCIHIALRVTSGGQTTACPAVVTVQDTTAPILMCPPDVTEIWTGGPAHGQTDPMNTGMATATDCDPAPVVAYSDVLNPGTQPGDPETVVTRTWTATDFCTNQSNCVQTITLLSPSGGLGSMLDVMPGSCPNVIASNGTGVLTLVLFSSGAFDATQVDRSSLVVRRRDNGGQVIQRMNVKLKDKGRPASSTGNCACGVSQPDGRPDLQVSVDYAQFLQAFEVANEAPGSQVTVAVTGRMLDGRLFTVTDCVTKP